MVGRGVGWWVGAPPGPNPSPRQTCPRLTPRPTQLAFAAAHAGLHVAAALLLAVALDLGVATTIRFQGVGAEGYFGLYRWYRGFEAAAFPDPAGLRDALSAATAGLYPGALKAAMAVYDAPEAIAVARRTLCGGAVDGASGGALAAGVSAAITAPARQLTRLQAAGYYGGMLAYYWLLATPTVGLLFG